MRVTQHSQRKHKGGRKFSPRHNDRNFDLSKAKNIDPAKAENNLYWSWRMQMLLSHKDQDLDLRNPLDASRSVDRAGWLWYEGQDAENFWDSLERYEARRKARKKMQRKGAAQEPDDEPGRAGDEDEQDGRSFLFLEREAYELMFSSLRDESSENPDGQSVTPNKHYEKQMARHVKNRQKNRIIPFDKWRGECGREPEEICIQIGKVGETPPRETAISCYIEYAGMLREWAAAHGNPFTILDMAIHVDEKVCHLHIRRVWHYRDDDGTLCIGQAKALEQAGVALPDPDARRDARNNRKMTFDAYTRKQLVQICRDHGLEIEAEPEAGVEHNMDKREYMLFAAVKVWEENERQSSVLDEKDAALSQRETDLERREAAVVEREQNAAQTMNGALKTAAAILASANQEAQEVLDEAGRDSMTIRKKAEKYAAEKRDKADALYARELTRAREAAMGDYAGLLDFVRSFPLKRNGQPTGKTWLDAFDARQEQKRRRQREAALPEAIRNVGEHTKQQGQPADVELDGFVR